MLAAVHYRWQMTMEERVVAQAQQMAHAEPASTASAAVRGTRQEPRGRPQWLGYLSVKRLSAVYLWVFFIVLFGLIAPDTFLTETTFRLVFRSGVITCVLALAFLVPLAAGAYDLSIGAVMSLALGLMVYLSIHTGIPTLAAAVLVLAVCALCGAVSGFIIVRLHVNSFIATLGVSQLLLGAVLLLSNNTQLVGNMPQSWADLGNNNLLGVPIVVYFLVILALVLWYVLEFTRIGRHLFATGGNPDAARLSGVPTRRVIWGAFIVSGTIAGAAGVIFSMQSALYSSSIGPGYLFPAVAAVFLGASQLSQRPNVWGTLIAYFALAFGIQGLVLSASSASVWSQPVFQGVSLIVAVALASRPALRKLREAKSQTTAASPAK
jgi:ribose transport system permease protein